MRLIHCIGDLLRKSQGIGDRHRAADGLAFHVLHDQVIRPDVVKRTDVGVVQRSDGLR